MKTKNKDELYAEVIQASKEAELGIAKCRICGYAGDFSSLITILFGGSLVFAICLNCANNGNEILIRRSLEGIEVLGKKAEILSIGTKDLDVLRSKPK
jgi:hypothetical protein